MNLLRLRGIRENLNLYREDVASKTTSKMVKGIAKTKIIELEKAENDCIKLILKEGNKLL